MQRPKTYTRMCLEEELRLAKQREQQPMEMESPEEQPQDKPQQPHQLPEWLRNVQIMSPEEQEEARHQPVIEEA
jgi:hypothetical protein